MSPIKGDRTRLMEKLEGAQAILLSLGGRIPEALPLAEAVVTLLRPLIRPSPADTP